MTSGEQLFTKLGVDVNEARGLLVHGANASDEAMQFDGPSSTSYSYPSTTENNFLNFSASECVSLRGNDSLFSSPASVTAFWHTLGLVGALAFGALILFMIARPLSVFRNVYRPREFHPTLPRPPRLPDGWFNWILPFLRITEEDYIDKYDFDVVMYLRFLKMCIKVFVIFCLSGAIVVIVNVTAHGNETGFARFSISNIPSTTDAKQRLWVHSLSLVFNCGVTMIVIWREYGSYYKLRRKHLVNSPARTTVMVTEVPYGFRTDQELSSYFKDLFGDQKILHAHIVRNHDVLVAKREELRSACRELLRARHTFWKSGKRPTVRLGMLGLIGREVDSIRYHEEKVFVLRQLVRRMQSPIEIETQEPERVGFITFADEESAMKCAQCLTHDNALIFNAELAPNPSDVNWDRFHVTPKMQYVRAAIVYLAMAILTFTFIGVVTTLQAMTSFDVPPGEGIRTIKFLNAFITWMETKAPPFLYGTFVGFAPQVVLIGLLTLIVYVVMALYHWRAYYSKSRAEEAALSGYFFFLIVNVFLANGLSGTIWDISDQIAVNLPLTIKLLGCSLPDQVPNYINFVMVQCFSGFLLILLHPATIFIGLFLRFFWAKTPQENEEAFRVASDPFEYFVYYSRELLIFAIGITYSSMAPIILPVALGYFVIGYNVSKYSKLYVYVPDFDGGGIYWPLAINRMLAALLIYEITLSGAFLLRFFYPGFIIALLCMIGTLVFWAILQARFYRGTWYLSLDTCRKIERKRRMMLGQPVNESSSWVVDEGGRASPKPADRLTFNLRGQHRRHYTQIDEKDIGSPFRLFAHTAYSHPALRPLHGLELVPSGNKEETLNPTDAQSLESGHAKKKKRRRAHGHSKLKGGVREGDSLRALNEEEDGLLLRDFSVNNGENNELRIVDSDDDDDDDDSGAVDHNEEGESDEAVELTAEERARAFEYDFWLDQPIELDHVVVENIDGEIRPIPRRLNRLSHGEKELRRVASLSRLGGEESQSQQKQAAENASSTSNNRAGEDPSMRSRARTNSTETVSETASLLGHEL